jgi:hypothetical protein
MPAYDSVGRNDLNGVSPVRPDPREQDPQDAIGVTETGAPRRLSLEDGELMSKGENLRLEIESGPHGTAEGGEQGNEQRGHAAADGISVGPRLLA